MKPKPFSALNHFTLPVAMFASLSCAKAPRMTAPWAGEYTASAHRNRGLCDGRHSPSPGSGAGNDLLRLDARRAGVDLLGVAAAGSNTDGLDVGQPLAARTPVRVADGHAEAGALATDVAGRSHREIS